MGKGRSQDGGSSGRGGRKGRPRKRSGEGAPPRDAGLQPSTSSRLFLTQLVTAGGVWKVFVTTRSSDRSAPVVHLQFERSSEGRQSSLLSRPLSGPLLDALHGGEPLSRADLENELEEAIREANATGEWSPDGG